MLPRLDVKLNCVMEIEPLGGNASGNAYGEIPRSRIVFTCGVAVFIACSYGSKSSAQLASLGSPVTQPALAEPIPRPKPHFHMPTPSVRLQPQAFVKHPAPTSLTTHPIWSHGTAVQGPGSALTMTVNVASGGDRHRPLEEFRAGWWNSILTAIGWLRTRDFRALLAAALALGAGLAAVLYRTCGHRWAIAGLLAPVASLPFLHIDLRPVLRVSHEMQECIELIQEALRDLNQKVVEETDRKGRRRLPRTSQPFILNLLLLKVLQEKYPPPAPRTRDIWNTNGPETASMFQEARQYMRHASAVYGVALCTALGLLEPVPLPLPPTIRDADRAYIRAHCKVADEDIKVMNMYYMEVLSPNHYLAVDHAHRAIVLSICGTSNTADLLTDLMATTTPFLDYKYAAHDGIACSARNVLLKIEPDLQAMLAAHPTYKLVLTGHSLGGGTAVLATYLLHCDPAFAAWVLGRRVECFAFAPPPVLTAPQVAEFAAPDARQAVRIFVYKDDWIASLSFASSYRLTQQLARVAALPLTRPERFAVILAGDPRAAAAGLVAANEFVAHTDNPHPDFPPLYHPGHLYVLQDQGEVVAVSRDANRDCFQELRITPTMGTDHLQPCYERALDAVCKRLGPVDAPPAVKAGSVIPEAAAA
eukprot:EG_transcript_3377